MAYTGEKKREYQRKWKAERRAKWFASKKCVVCGTTENLELDHIDPTLKVSHNIWSWSWKRINEETAKCQVLCSKHHIEKTFNNKEHLRGSEVTVSKLNDLIVSEIKCKFSGGATKLGLAREYGVDEKAIRLLLKGETWAHVN